MFTNPTADEVSERVDVTGWAAVGDLLCEPLQREESAVLLSVPGLEVRVLALER